MDLFGAQLQGANLSFATLQGANLTGAALQGANLSEAQLQGAALSNAKVWRAWGTPIIDLADLDGLDAVTMPWDLTNAAPSSFAAWRDDILDDTSADFRNKSIAKRLSVLDPALDEPEHVIIAEFWKNSISTLPQGEERQKVRAAFLANLGCASESAPYVARGLIYGRAPAVGKQVAIFRDSLRKGRSEPSACPGVKGFTDDDWAALAKQTVFP